MDTPEKIITDNTWILYKTTNLVNGKIYIGVHKLSNTKHSKNYLGSGLTLKPAIKKYGRANFTRITIAEFICAEDVYNAEARVVNEDFIKREDTYNIQIGGKGGVTPTEETRIKIGAVHKNKVVTQETRAKLSSASKGRLHSETTKAKLSAANKNKKLTEETKAKIKASNTRPDNSRNKPVIINGKYYETAKFAAKIENIPNSTLWNRLKNNKPEWSEWRYATENF